MPRQISRMFDLVSWSCYLLIKRWPMLTFPLSSRFWISSHFIDYFAIFCYFYFCSWVQVFIMHFCFASFVLFSQVEAWNQLPFFYWKIDELLPADLSLLIYQLMNQSIDFVINQTRFHEAYLQLPSFFFFLPYFCIFLFTSFLWRSEYLPELNIQMLFI